MRPASAARTASARPSAGVNRAMTSKSDMCRTLSGDRPGGKQPETVTSQSAGVPDLRHLRYVVAVADELNFTRAAAREGVSQQVLSAQIRQLEDELGVPLFDRSTRQVRVTEAGAAVAERGRALLREVEALWEDVRRHGTGHAGVVRLGFWRSAAFATAPRLVAAMAEAHPDVRIDVCELPSPELPQALRD